MDYLLLICLAASFLVTYLLIPFWINTAHRIKLTGKDMNKYDKPEVAELGGLPVMAGFLAGILLYIGIVTFYYRQVSNTIYILAVISTILIIMVIGLIDDILGWKIGLRQWQKPLLTLPAALPMMVVNAGETVMSVPVVGAVDFGILYPLLIIPIAITGAANGFNMLAGYNGLEAGMGTIILGTLGLAAWLTGNGWIALLSFSMVFALLAFLRYNWYPARIFPGDIFTYSVGALIASVAILGNMEKIALLLFTPYFIDFLLPLRKKMKVEAFAKPNKDGSLEMPYNRIYDITHLAIFVLKRLKENVHERDVTLFIFAIELMLAIAAVFVWVI